MSVSLFSNQTKRNVESGEFRHPPPPPTQRYCKEQYPYV